MNLHAYSLTLFCTNNSPKYEALLLGLTFAIDIKVKHLIVCGDSLLVIQEKNLMLKKHFHLFAMLHIEPFSDATTL